MCRYDGQVFVKPPEVLARDRLLGSYTVSSVKCCNIFVSALSRRTCCHQGHSFTHNRHHGLKLDLI